MTAEEFAKSSFDRDVRVGIAYKEDWDEVKNEYLAEAAHYVSRPKAEWPCHVLCELKQHHDHHSKSCEDSDI